MGGLGGGRFPVVLQAQFHRKAEGKTDNSRCVSPHLARSSVFPAQNTWVWWPSTFFPPSFSALSQLPSLMTKWRLPISSVWEQWLEAEMIRRSMMCSPFIVREGEERLITADPLTHLDCLLTPDLAPPRMVPQRTDYTASPCKPKRTV